MGRLNDTEQKRRESVSHDHDHDQGEMLWSTGVTGVSSDVSMCRQLVWFLNEPLGIHLKISIRIKSFIKPIMSY